FGCLYAGVVAVPAYPPRANDRRQERLAAIARDAEPRAILTTGAIVASLAGREGLAARLPELAAARFVATDELPASLGADRDAPEPEPRSIAFLQYTSGSTATPKGVQVTHANLLANERMIGAAFGMSAESVVVGWLPLYHDMGLIGNVLQPLFCGGRCVLMSPVAFLQRPRRWLEAIARHRATTSGGPNFAYELCVRKVPPEDRRGLDLSSWTVAFNGAEPVRAATLARFAEAFAPCGFRREALYPCYGLAEATLFVTGGVRGREPRVLAVAGEALERNAVEAVALEAAGARELVSSGAPRLGQRVAIVDPDSREMVGDGRVGEVWVAGSSVAAGYWRQPEATERDFAARLLDGSGPFLRTGDLGFGWDGELFVTGRLKDLIIVRGRNCYPQDLERTAEEAHPRLRPGCGAAFAVESADGDPSERLVVVQEVERQVKAGSAEAAEIARAVRQAVAQEHEVPVHEVVLTRIGAVPKTSSGKVQRRATRQLYLDGELPVVGRSASGGDEGAAERPEAEAFELSPVVALVAEAAAAALGVPVWTIDVEQPLAAFGIDSLSAVELQASVETAFGVTVPLDELIAGASVKTVAELVGKAAPEGVVPEPLGRTAGGAHELALRAQTVALRPRSTPAARGPLVVSEQEEERDLPPSVGQRAL
ncbi:MAG TPA: AMP-binding protein, partial [Thermoanaerobaculia bacterium]